MDLDTKSGSRNCGVYSVQGRRAPNSPWTLQYLSIYNCPSVVGGFVVSKAGLLCATLNQGPIVDFRWTIYRLISLFSLSNFTQKRDVLSYTVDFPRISLSRCRWLYKLVRSISSLVSSCDEENFSGFSQCARKSFLLC